MPSTHVRKKLSPEPLTACMARAARHCLDTQDARGAWQVLPDPRIFETALAAYALSNSPDAQATDAVERARAWVRTASPQNHHPLAYAIERALTDILLNTSNRVDLSHPGFEGAVFSSRARLLYALALHAGKEIISTCSNDQLRAIVEREFRQCAQTQLKQWSKVDLFSTRILLESHYQNHAAVAEAARHLEAVQSPDGSFFFNPVSTSMAFLALSIAAPRSDAWRRCCAHLLDAQQTDGTWRFCTSDIWDTTLTIRSFRGYPLFDTRALHRAAEFLLESQSADGGWAFRSGVESDNDTTASALMALVDLPRYREAVDRALAYISRAQMDDGLWRTWHFTRDPPVEDTVAHVVTALELYTGRHAVSVDAAKRWLIQRYRDHGRWNASWYYGLPYAVLEVGRALSSEEPTVISAVATLESAQDPDGGWGSEPGMPSAVSSTGMAIAALLQYQDEHSPAVRAGLSYIIETQRQDGTWQGQPEMYGPRPLISHFQTHTQAFVFLGLRDLLRHAHWREPRVTR